MKISENCYKLENMANPISPNVFCADPTAVEYNGRLYIYGTNDHQQYEAVGDDGKNDYVHTKSIVMLSTDDMVNWEYHGFIDTAKIAPWIVNSWAPSVASRVEADGKTHFYLYFSNSGCGVGVITAAAENQEGKNEKTCSVRCGADGGIVADSMRGGSGHELRDVGAATVRHRRAQIKGGHHNA